MTRTLGRGLARCLRKLGRSRIADAAEGAPLYFAGTVVSDGAGVRAPLSGRPCLAYDLEVVVGLDHLSRLHREGRGVDFLVSDGSGAKALVLLGNDRGPIQRLSGHEVRQSLDDVDATRPEMARLLARPEIADHVGALVTSPLCLERVLVSRDHVAVAGVGRWEPDVAPDTSTSAWPGYRDAPRMLVVRSGKELALIVTDDVA